MVTATELFTPDRAASHAEVLLENIALHEAGIKAAIRKGDKQDSMDIYIDVKSSRNAVDALRLIQSLENSFRTQGSLKVDADSSTVKITLDHIHQAGANELGVKALFTQAMENFQESSIDLGARQGRGI